MPQGFMELDQRVELLSSEHMPSGVFPESLYNVEIRRIRWHEYKLDVQPCRLFLYSLAVLVTRIVKDNGDRDVPAGITNLTEKILYLTGVYIFHGVGFNQVKCEGVNAAQHVKPVATGSTSEGQWLPAPHMTEERFKSEVGSIHEKESAFPFFCLFNNGLQILDSFLLSLGVGLTRYGLKLPETISELMKQHSGIALAEPDPAYTLNYGNRFCGCPGYPVFKCLVYMPHLTFDFTGPACFGKYGENGINTFFVIRMNHVANKVAAASHEIGHSLTAQGRCGHLCEQCAASFSYDTGRGLVDFSFENINIILRILYGKQSCISKNILL